MTERLTDEQVAAMRALTEHGTYPGTPGTGTANGVPVVVEVRHLIHNKDVQALTAEVQQSRARRCGNCAKWDGRHKDDIDDGCPLRYHWPAADWSCADFVLTPRP